jgi:hypothetical protein
MCKSLRDDRVNREAADSGERSIYANGEHTFAVATKPYYAGIPIGPEPFDLAKPLGAASARGRSKPVGRCSIMASVSIRIPLYPKISVAAIRDDLHPQG